MSNLKEIKDAARQAFRDQQSQDTEGGVPDIVSFCAGFLAGYRHKDNPMRAAIVFPDWLKKFTTNLEIPSNNEEELPIEIKRYIEELLSVLVKAPNHTVFVLIDREPYSISLSDNQEIVVKKLDK